MKVGEIIREIMIVNALSQDKLAQILDVSQKTISNWLNGNDIPKAHNLVRIYETFGITPNEMLGIEDPKNFTIIS